VGLKALVGEHSVVAEGDAKGCHDEERQKKGEVDPSDIGVPEKDNGRNDPEDGKPNQG
jgi:hypothetical protein